MPPQSPTAWSNFITGAPATSHGIFDFVHRDPHSLDPHLSTSQVTPPNRLIIGPLAIPVGGGDVELLRRERPFWRYLSDAAVPATVVKIPAHFPPTDDGNARVLSGMGTPDLLGTYGTFTLLTSDPAWHGRELSGGRVLELTANDRGGYDGVLDGPANPFSAADNPLTESVQISLDRNKSGALVEIGAHRVVLAAGEWSEFVPITFSILPGYQLSAIARLYLKSTAPHVTLYMSPLNIDPRAPALPVSSPNEFASELADLAGPYFTQGMPEESKALTAGVLTHAEYLAQAKGVLAQREKIFRKLFSQFKAGLMFFYFSSTDQIAHMFYRAHDETHPARTDADTPYKDVIRSVYRRMDAIIGEVLASLEPKDLFLVMSDHGFAPAAYLFDLNRWLLNEGYLVLRDKPGAGAMGHVDWQKTQAYGLGLNGLYLNLVGRESHGVVPKSRYARLVERLSDALLDLRHPETGAALVTSVEKPRSAAPTRSDSDVLSRAPDLIVGYARNVKVADVSARGSLGEKLVSINRSEWSGDHCVDHRHVPGILFANRALRGGAHSLLDLAPTVLNFFGVSVPDVMVGTSVLATGAPAKGE